MTTVQRWSGLEIRALREAKRMSLREFAAHLGVSERIVSKWEKGGADINPRPVNQAALDTCLAQSDPEVRARFSHLTNSSVTVTGAGAGADEVTATPVDDRVVHPTDGTLMARVDGSVYLSGANNTPIWVPACYIDVYPVTNSSYAQFIAATNGTPPSHWVDGQYPASLADHPVVFVTWEDANRYAKWAGKALPTSQQWEKAARGTRGNVYPWGDQATPAKCNVRENGIGSTTPVDRYQSGASPYGVYDMCGNIWEWTSTQSSAGRYELKGAAWTSPFERATPSAWNDASTTMCDDDTGFRCAIPAQALEGLLQQA